MEFVNTLPWDFLSIHSWGGIFQYTPKGRYLSIHSPGIVFVDTFPWDVICRYIPSNGIWQYTPYGRYLTIQSLGKELVNIAPKTGMYQTISPEKGTGILTMLNLIPVCQEIISYGEISIACVEIETCF